MAEVTAGRTGEFLRKLFTILLQHPDGMQAREALTALQTQVQLTDYERGSYESGGMRFEKIVRFATVDCVKASWMAKQKGRWSVTDKGREALKSYPDPEVFYKEARKLYVAWKASQPEEIEEEAQATPQALKR